MQEAEATFRISDRRHTAVPARPGMPADMPAGYRAHAVVLGHNSDDQAVAWLRARDVHADARERLLGDGARARSRIATLPPLQAAGAVEPVQDAAARAVIDGIMARPDCRTAFPQDRWTAALVDIAELIPLSPSLDVAYADSLGDPGLDPSDPLSAVRLCFNPRPPSSFHVSLDHAQKSVNIVGINPSLEVVSLRCSQQPDDGPLLVSFLVAAPPNLVVVLRHHGRLILCDGHHRVYRLLKAGFAQAPCVVQDVSGLQDVARHGTPLSFPGAVLMASRPPLFPDFADPQLGSIAPLRAVRRITRIRPDEYMVPS